MDAIIVIAVLLMIPVMLLGYDWAVRADEQPAPAPLALSLAGHRYSIGWRQAIWALNLTYGFAIATVVLLNMDEPISLVVVVITAVLTAAGLTYFDHASAQEARYVRAVVRMSASDAPTGRTVTAFDRPALWYAVLVIMLITAGVAAYYRSIIGALLYGGIAVIIGVLLRATRRFREDRGRKRTV